MKKLTLELTLDAFEELHAVLATARRTTKSVRVDRDALDTLLRDHSRLLKLHEGRVEA